MEQRLLAFEKDLVDTLEVINKQFKLSTAISQQKQNIQKFIDDLVDGLVNDGRITFWAHDQEVNLNLILYRTVIMSKYKNHFSL